MQALVCNRPGSPPTCRRLLKEYAGASQHCRKQCGMQVLCSHKSRICKGECPHLHSGHDFSHAKPLAFNAGCVASWGTSSATCRCPTSAHTMLAAAKPISPCRNWAVNTEAEPLPSEGLAGCAAAQASHRSLPVLLACKSSNQWEWRCDA